MLTQKQWQWLADHHEKVRRLSWSFALVVLVIYISLMLKTGLDAGKGQTPYKPITDYREKYGCKEKLTPFNMGPFGGNKPSPPEYYADASIFRLERHYTWMLDAEALFKFPECIGAMLSDTANSPNPDVFLFYDKQKKHVIYRVARIDDVLKK